LGFHKENSGSDVRRKDWTLINVSCSDTRTFAGGIVAATVLKESKTSMSQPFSPVKTSRCTKEIEDPICPSQLGVPCYKCRGAFCGSAPGCGGLLRTRVLCTSPANISSSPL
jgi:hypothetical protein